MHYIAKHETCHTSSVTKEMQERIRNSQNINKSDSRFLTSCVVVSHVGVSTHQHRHYTAASTDNV